MKCNKSVVHALLLNISNLYILIKLALSIFCAAPDGLWKNHMCSCN